MGYFPEIGEGLNIPLDKFITFDANDCGYGGYAHNLMVNWVQPSYLKAKYVYNNTGNTNW